MHRQHLDAATDSSQPQWRAWIKCQEISVYDKALQIEHCAGRNYFLRKLKAARTEHFGNKGTANHGVE